MLLKMLFECFLSRFCILDDSIFKELESLGGKEDSPRLVQMFQKTFDKLIISIQNDVYDRNYELLFKHAHELKGAALSIGACRLAFLCNKVCRDIERGKYGRLHNLALKIHTIGDRTIIKLKKFKDQ